MIHHVLYGIIIILMLAVYIPNVDGHGLGFEVLPPVWIGDRQVTLEVSSNTENVDDQIQFVLMESESGNAVHDVTYQISAYKKGVHLFDEKFVTKNGILVFSFKYADTDIVMETKEDGGFFSSVFGNDEKTINVAGRPFEFSGLYTFDVKLLAVGTSLDDSDQVITYSVGISIPQQTQWTIHDPNFGKNLIDTISYYDEITDFEYDSTSKTVSFSMPFEWTFGNINETSVVHEEFSFEKSFGDLLVAEYIVEINDNVIAENTVNVDDSAEETRVVHIVVSQKILLELEESLRDQNTMYFEIRPSENTVYSTITNNGQFKVDLWQDTKSHTEKIFYFQIKDVFLKDKPVAVKYNLVIVHEDKVIFEQEGTSLTEEANTAHVEIAEEFLGLVLVRFENLDDSTRAQAEIPVIIEKSAQMVPGWIKQTANWWVDGTVSDDEFLASMSYLVRDGIIQVEISKVEMGSEGPIPIWIKQTANWWVDGTVSDDEFLASITYLVSSGIIIL